MWFSLKGEWEMNNYDYTCKRYQEKLDLLDLELDGLEKQMRDLQFIMGDLEASLALLELELQDNEPSDERTVKASMLERQWDKRVAEHYTLDAAITDLRNARQDVADAFGAYEKQALVDELERDRI